MSKHTPGPWSWDQGDIGEDSSVRYCTVFDDKESVIAEVNEQGDPDVGAERAA